MCSSRGRGKGRGRERISSRLPTEHRAWRRAWFQNPEIMTWAETKRYLTHWATEVPAISMVLGNSGLRLVFKKPVHGWSFQCYPSRAHGKSEGTPGGCNEPIQGPDYNSGFLGICQLVVEFFSGKAEIHLSSRNSTTMILYSSSSSGPFKIFALFTASLKKPLLLD